MTIPQYLKEYAHEFALLRIKENSERYQGTHKQRTGNINSVLLGTTDREYYTEYIGILAELIIRHELEKNKKCVEYTASSLLKSSNFATNDADITAYHGNGSTRFSVKGCEGSMKANKQAMDDEEVDIVAFVIFETETSCTIKYYRPDEVRQWELKSAFSDYYYKEL
jgi:hypothetical protein